MGKLNTVADNINFSEEENKTLEHWKATKTFEQSLKLSEGRPRYTFYDGPPFATGLPHYGHILAGTIKDTVTRWAHQNGYYVERRFGWDTHGLPVEFEVDKTIGIKGPEDVLKMGIGNYNAQCRSIVMRYSEEWKNTIQRVGRWIDFENDYKTLYPWFMESVWWVFSELVKKNLVYRGVKVMPFSTGCSTPLSNFEAGQNYKDVVDPACFIGFQQKDNKNRYFVAWTTTPWTLPSNLALCVHPELDYAIVEDKATGKELIMLECRLSELFKKPDMYNVIEKVKGITFKDMEYEPLFPYFAHLKKSIPVFKVLTGTFVTTDQGTGVVHQAPYFGEIDYATCLEHKVITKEMKIVCPVDQEGKFTDEVTDFKGMYVKDADKVIMKHLKDRGNLLKQEQCKHSYPFCWRSDTPLLYKAVPSWFIKVETLIPQLLKNNDETYWVPSFVKEKRFANWLRDARDWAVSRNRFWGTPINLWVSDDFEEIVCPSSIAELEELTGAKITDIHRESVDHLTIPSKQGKGTLKRVSEVFDCWFESGSMPYAQQHYPFENKDIFDTIFPADFIAEGIDQTRGWFYTLLVLATALFDKPPFKNLICNGLILASDGNKMSKSKKNYPDPLTVIEKYGADALRLYLINSPVVRGENLRFREEGVKEVLKDVFLPWYNAYRFFVQKTQLFEHDTKEDFKFIDTVENVMDKWILSFTNSLVGFVRKEMSEYHLYAVVSPLAKYFDTLTNTYIRLNRKRFQGDDKNDRLEALSTLGKVICIIVKLMAPFTPFFSDFLWKNLKNVLDAPEDSVHFTMIPEPDTGLICESVERRVFAMRSVVDLVRVLRERKAIPVKYPLKEVIVINRCEQFLEDLKSLESYVLVECNVKSLIVSQDKEKYGVTLKAEPNFKLLGAKLRGDQKKVVQYLKEASDDVLSKFLEDGEITIFGHVLTTEEVAIKYTFDETKSNNDEKYETHSDSQTVVILNTEADESLVEEGLAREVVNRIQKLRKEAKLVSTESAKVYCKVADTESQLYHVVKKHKETIENATSTPMVIVEDIFPEDLVIRAKNSSQVKGVSIDVALV
uniref:Isoleucine--tRNA ligase, cytoplasmic n=1 Tax=Parastrongyloides trichosuri TaxID=131310 RepID=A0A0N4Z237_PARTI